MSFQTPPTTMLLQVLFFCLLLIVNIMQPTSAFVVQRSSSSPTNTAQRTISSPAQPSPTMLQASSSNNDGDFSFLQTRVDEMRLACLEREWQRPPNAALTPEQFCTSLLEALQTPDDPWPEAGFRTLLRCSTSHWKEALYQSVGAPFPQTSEEHVASALASAMSSSSNQFQLLVQPNVLFDFPKEPLDFYDGTCWMECRLFITSGRKATAVALLGFSLLLEEHAWMLEDMTWQDLRDQPRSGWQEQTWR
jgi:hypothetical protein